MIGTQVYIYTPQKNISSMTELFGISVFKWVKTPAFKAAWKAAGHSSTQFKIEKCFDSQRTYFNVMPKR